MRKNKNLAIALFSLVFLSGAFFSVFEVKAAGFQYQLLEKIPGAPDVGSDLPKYVTAIYNTALVIIVLSAVLMLSIGGFMYLTSAGNTAALSTAKKVIFDAIIGLAIALTAWLLLNVINPDLVNINLSSLSLTSTEPKPVPVIPPTSCPSPPVPTAACCPVGIPCKACAGNCVPLTAVTYKGCGLSTCFLNLSLLGKILAIHVPGDTTVPSWRITESWPPTVAHQSACHQDGTCADLNNSGGPTDVATIKKYFDAFKEAGLNVLYENANDCAPYTAAGINCKSYPTQTNLSSFHVS